MKISDYQKSKSPPTEYLWIQKLTGSSRNLESSPNDVHDSADPVSLLNGLSFECALLSSTRKLFDTRTFSIEVNV